MQKATTILEEDPWLFTDKYNVNAKQVNPDFVENRHDQSISSVARKLLGCVRYPDETYTAGSYIDEMMDKPFWATRMN